jgi:hypothetical protein
MLDDTVHLNIKMQQPPKKPIAELAWISGQEVRSVGKRDLLGLRGR